MIGTGTLFLNNFVQNETIKWVHHIHQSVQNWHLITKVGYNKSKISGSRQCILGQAKLVMVLVQLTLCKIIMHDLSIYFRGVWKTRKSVTGTGTGEINEWFKLRSMIDINTPPPFSAFLARLMMTRGDWVWDDALIIQNIFAYVCRSRQMWVV